MVATEYPVGLESNCILNGISGIRLSLIYLTCVATVNVNEIKDVSLFGSHLGSVTSHFDLILTDVNVITRGDDIDQGILSDLKKIKEVKLTIDKQGKSIVPSVPYHTGFNLKLSREDATTLANNINSLYPKKERITANDIDYTREIW